MKQFELRKINTGQFTTIPLELKDFIDFPVKRVYFMTQTTTGFSRQHAHYIEEELFIMVQGTAIATIDRGRGIEEVSLVGGEDAIYVPSMVWHGFKDVSSDAIIAALSSTNYDPTRSDYLEDYEAYRRVAKR